MVSESPYFSRRIPASHRGRVNGVFTIVRTAVTSLFQLFIGAVYTARGPRTAWITVLVVGAGFVLLAFIMRSRDRADFPNLYRSDRSGAAGTDGSNG